MWVVFTALTSAVGGSVWAQGGTPPSRVEVLLSLAPPAWIALGNADAIPVEP